MFYGSILFRFFGVLTRWIFLNLLFYVRKKGKMSFLTVWRGGDSSNNDPINSSTGEFRDILIGVVVVFLMVLLIWELGGK